MVLPVIPLYVPFGTETCRDGIDLISEEFYNTLRHNKTLTITSVPSPGTFTETYDKLAKETDEILAITLGSKLSATCEVVLQARGLMKRKCCEE